MRWCIEPKKPFNCLKVFDGESFYILSVFFFRGLMPSLFDLHTNYWILSHLNLHLLLKVSLKFYLVAFCIDLWTLFYNLRKDLEFSFTDFQNLFIDISCFFRSFLIMIFRFYSAVYESQIKMPQEKKHNKVDVIRHCA